jgi:hypothetical protein
LGPQSRNQAEKGKNEKCRLLHRARR